MKATVYATSVAEDKDAETTTLKQGTGLEQGQDEGHEKGMKRAQKGHEKVLEAIKDDSSVSIPLLAEKCGCSVKAVRTILDTLKADGIIRHVGPAKGGHWEVINPQS